MIKVMLAVPRKGNCIEELQSFLNQEIADIYIFPEGFLTTDDLQQALSIIRTNRKYVITGYKDLNCNGQHKALVIDSGEIVDEYTKCILTKGEKLKRKDSGEAIRCVNMKYGKVGIPICYEMHFPEVARVMSLEEQVLLINIIGTGMYHDLQLEQWTTLAKARAIENEIYVVGCSHFDGAIPLAYAFEPSGKCVLMKKGEYGGFVVDIDQEQSKMRSIGYREDRVPKLFSGLAE